MDLSNECNSSREEQEEQKVLKTKALELVTRAIEGIDDDQYELELWYEFIRNKTNDEFEQRVMDDDLNQVYIFGIASEYFDIAMKLLKQHLKEKGIIPED